MNRSKFLGYALGPIGISFLGFITLPIIAWFYTVEDVGRISMLQVSTSFTILLFCFGLDQAYVREYHDSNDKALLLKNIMLLPVVFLILLSCFILLISPAFISKLLYGIESFYLSLITILCFISASCSRFLSLILRMEERSYAFSMSQLLPKILLLLFVFLTLLCNLPKDSFNLLTAFVLSFVFSFFIYCWNTRGNWLKAISKKIIFKDLKNYFYFGFPLIFSGLAMWALNVSDRVFLKSLSTLTELGVYSLAATIAGVASVFAGIFNTIWAPMVYKWHAKNNIDIGKISVISGCILAVIYFVIMLFGLFSWIVPYVLPPQYKDVQYLILACLVGPLFYTLSEVTGIGISISKRTVYSFYASIIVVIISVVLNMILIPIYGAKGAASSFAISFWFFLILKSYLSNQVWYALPFFRVSAITFFIVVIVLANLIVGLSYYVWFLLIFFGFFLFYEELLLFKNSILNFISK